MVTFHSKIISPTVTRIYGLMGELMYLVEGSERAALIDTGSGAGSLKEYVASLTSLPIIVLITHGHVDHAMGTPEFDTVYMSSIDNDMYMEHRDFEVRKGYLSGSPEFSKVEESDYIPLGTCENFHDLKEGDVFDLGGVTIETFACPGHTRGSMVFLLREERTLLTGDACNGFTFLFDSSCLGLTSYENNLRALEEKVAGRYDRTYVSHGPGDSPKELVAGVIDLCEKIKAGTVDNVPYQFGDRGGFLAMAYLPNGTRSDGGVGNIVYDPDRIYE